MEPADVFFAVADDNPRRRHRHHCQRRRHPATMQPVTCDGMAPLLVTVPCTGTGGVTSAYWGQPPKRSHTAEFRCCTTLRFPHNFCGRQHLGLLDPQAADFRMAPPS